MSPNQEKPSALDDGIPPGGRALRDGLVPPESDFGKLLVAAVGRGASDLHLSSGLVAKARIDGRIQDFGTARLPESELLRSIAQAVDERVLRELDVNGSVDFALALTSGARFRVNAFRHHGGVGVALRRLPETILPLETLGLPAQFRDLLTLPRGLILVTGPTGSGKTTTLASAVQAIAQTSAQHIVTLEQPIEYLHPQSQSIVHQREVPTHTPSFTLGLRDALREDPDVIVVGEMRDLETIRIALTAAETGHLVLASLHTVSAAKTIDRIIDIFPEGQKEHIRAQLSTALTAVICQQLAARAEGGGRVVAYEFMRTTPAIANLIREGKTFQIPSQIQTGRANGMIRLDDHLAQLVGSRAISKEEAISLAEQPAELSARFRKA